jgi:hypothetical protein
LLKTRENRQERTLQRFFQSHFNQSSLSRNRNSIGGPDRGGQIIVRGALLWIFIPNLEIFNRLFIIDMGSSLCPILMVPSAMAQSSIFASCNQ